MQTEIQPQEKLYICPNCGKPLETFTCIRFGASHIAALPCDCKKASNLKIDK